MKIVVAPNAFKGSITAREAADAIELGIIEADLRDIDVEKFPIADGGDGVVDVLKDAFQGNYVSSSARDPLFRNITTEFCFLPVKKTAVIEMASASGLRLLKDNEKTPLNTSTAGTGDLIKAALDLNVERLLIGLGGSATNDGGCGMASALGVKFKDKKGITIEPVGKNLKEIDQIDMSGLDSRLAKVDIEAICDVSNPLLGNQGAATVYAPQKGASPDDVELLEIGMENLANVIKRDLGVSVHTMPSGGAAGGIGAGIYAFLNASLRPGADIVLDLIEIDKAIENCDLVITGEGQIDGQTVYGKAPAAVASRAMKFQKPCLAFAGSRGSDSTSLYEAGFTAVFSICPGPILLKDAMTNGKQLLKDSSREAIRCFLAKH